MGWICNSVSVTDATVLLQCYINVSLLKAGDYKEDLAGTFLRCSVESVTVHLQDKRLFLEMLLEEGSQREGWIL